MFRSPNSYLSTISPTNDMPPWSLNKAIKHAMDRQTLQNVYSAPDYFADTDPCQFTPWPTQEKLAFGRELLPKLVHKLELTRRELFVLQYLRSLEHLLYDPELSLDALNLNVLKSLNSLLVWGTDDVKFWVLACLRVLVGSPFGKSCIIGNESLLNEVIKNWSAERSTIRHMTYDILRLLSENWFAVNMLQRKGCIKLILETISSMLSRDAVYGNEKPLVCLLETLTNLIDHKQGVLKAIRYDLFELKWLLTCGLLEVENAILSVFVSVAKDEIGRLGLKYKSVIATLIDAIKDPSGQTPDPVLTGRALMFSTLPSNERRNYANMNIIEVAMDVLSYPNLSNTSRLVMVKLLTNLAELPEGQSAIKEHLERLLTQKVCGSSLQASYATLLKKILKNP